MRILEMSLSLERGRFEARMKHEAVLFSSRLFSLSLFLYEKILIGDIFRLLSFIDQINYLFYFIFSFRKFPKKKIVTNGKNKSFSAVRKILLIRR